MVLFLYFLVLVAAKGYLWTETLALYAGDDKICH